MRPLPYSLPRGNLAGRARFSRGASAPRHLLPQSGSLDPIHSRLVSACFGCFGGPVFAASFEAGDAGSTGNFRQNSTMKAGWPDRGSPGMAANIGLESPCQAMIRPSVMKLQGRFRMHRTLEYQTCAAHVRGCHPASGLQNCCAARPCRCHFFGFSEATSAHRWRCSQQRSGIPAR